MVLSRKVGDLAQKRANQSMRAEILPQLGLVHPRPNSWNPLRQAKGRGYALKLQMPDPLVMEILQTPTLRDLTAKIVTDSVMTAALEEPKSFVTAIFDSLMTDG